MFLDSLFLADSSGAVEAIQRVFTNITSSITIADLVQIIGVGIGACIGLVLFYFGARKLTRMVIKAFKSGRLSF